MPVFKYRDPQTGEWLPLSSGGAGESIDAYTKEETLSEETKVAFGLGANAVPDDVFTFLGKYNQHFWKRRTVSGEYAVIKGSVVTSADNNYDTWVMCADLNATAYNISYSSSVSVDKDGNISLVNPSTVSVSRNTATNAKVLAGKYIKKELMSDSGVSVRQYAYIPSDATPVGFSTGSSASGSNGSVSFGSARVGVRMNQQILSTKYNEYIGEWGLVTADNKDAYPSGGFGSDGYEYQYLGVPFQNSVTAPKIATGSYTGTGTYGESKPSSIMFDFAPKLVMITCYTRAHTNTDYYPNGIQYFHLSPGGYITILNMDVITSEAYAREYGFGGSSNAYSKKSPDGKTLYWYSTSNAENQFNNSGWDFHYIAIG